jgi:hypothetical protein
MMKLSRFFFCVQVEHEHHKRAWYFSYGVLPLRRAESCAPFSPTVLYFFDMVKPLLMDSMSSVYKQLSKKSDHNDLAETCVA